MSLRRCLRQLLDDERGGALDNLVDLFGTTLTYCAVVFTMLGIVQLGKIFSRRDIVDDAAEQMRDVVTKAYCQTGGDVAATQAAVDKRLASLTKVGGLQSCRPAIRPADSSGDDGSVTIDIRLDCEFDCVIPVTAPGICPRGNASLSAELRTTATGCDGEGT